VHIQIFDFIVFIFNRPDVKNDCLSALETIKRLEEEINEKNYHLRQLKDEVSQVKEQMGVAKFINSIYQNRYRNSFKRSKSMTAKKEFIEERKKSQFRMNNGSPYSKFLCRSSRQINLEYLEGYSSSEEEEKCHYPKVIRIPKRRRARRNRRHNDLVEK
jgi:hypothetical protein